MPELARPPRLTPEQFERLPNSRGLELIDGVVTEKTMGTEAGSINARISYYLNAVVIPNRLGCVIESEGVEFVAPPIRVEGEEPRIVFPPALGADGQRLRREFDLPE